MMHHDHHVADFDWKPARLGEDYSNSLGHNVQKHLKLSDIRIGLAEATLEPTHSIIHIYIYIYLAFIWRNTAHIILKTTELLGFIFTHGAKNSSFAKLSPAKWSNLSWQISKSQNQPTISSDLSDSCWFQESPKIIIPIENGLKATIKKTSLKPPRSSFSCIKLYQVVSPII